VEGGGQELVLKYYFDIPFEGLRKAMKKKTLATLQDEISQHQQR
jgi:hypothetical protein